MRNQDAMFIIGRLDKISIMTKEIRIRLNKVYKDDKQSKE